MGVLEPGSKWRPGLKAPPRAAGENDRQIGMAVRVAIAQATAINDHGVIEQRFAVAVFRLAHALEEVGELLGVELVDLRNLFQDFRLVLVVR